MKKREKKSIACVYILNRKRKEGGKKILPLPIAQCKGWSNV